jgi:hypothetical protein
VTAKTRRTPAKKVSTPSATTGKAKSPRSAAKARTDAPASAPAAKRPEKARANALRKMKAYVSFDSYLADQPAMHQRLIRALRRFVARTAPRLVESVKWGNGCWLSGKAPIAYVYAAEDYVQFGFVNGAALDDRKGLLRGNGRYVRHVPVRRLADVDERAFAALLRRAIELGHPAFGE